MRRSSWSKRHLRLCPELARFSRDDKSAQRWIGLFSDGWWIALWIGILLVIAWSIGCLTVILFAMGFLPASHPGLRSFLMVLIATAFLAWIPGCWVAGQWASFVSNRNSRRRLRAELRTRSIPICIACGYEGGDIAAPKCPECGAPHTPPP